MMVCLSDDELEALRGLPAPAVLMYVMALRPRMDYKTGFVGLKPKISWRAIQEWLYVEPNRHGIQPPNYSVPQLRRAKVWLEKAGLLESFGQRNGKNGEHGNLKFLCLLARQKSLVQKITDRKPTGLSTR